MILGFGEFDHHQKNRNGKRENGIYYSSIGLLWKRFGKKYLEKIKVDNIDKVFEYMDKELIQYIDATDNMQFEYLENKIIPDFLSLFNPEWNEDIEEGEAFINALKVADIFWKVYIKHAIAEVQAIEMIIEKINNSKECYVIFDREMPYKKAIKYANNDNVKYIIFKSKRECYDVRTIVDTCRFKNELLKYTDISIFGKEIGIEDLIYVDISGKLCCTKTLDSAIKLVKYNEDI